MSLQIRHYYETSHLPFLVWVGADKKKTATAGKINAFPLNTAPFPVVSFKILSFGVTKTSDKTPTGCLYGPICCHTLFPRQPPQPRSNLFGTLTKAQSKSSHGMLGGINNVNNDWEKGKGWGGETHLNTRSFYDGSSCHSRGPSLRSCTWWTHMRLCTCTRLGQLLSHWIQAKEMFWQCRWARRTNSQPVCQRSFLITLILSTTVCFTD